MIIVRAVRCGDQNWQSCMIIVRIVRHGRMVGAENGYYFPKASGWIPQQDIDVLFGPNQEAWHRDFFLQFFRCLIFEKSSLFGIGTPSSGKSRCTLFSEAFYWHRSHSSETLPMLVFHMKIYPKCWWTHRAGGLTVPVDTKSLPITYTTMHKGPG